MRPSNRCFAPERLLPALISCLLAFHFAAAGDAWAGAQATPAPGAPPAASTTSEPVIVIAAPGFPGTTAQAQPTMDLFARTLAGAAGVPASGVATSYYESEAAGIAALGRPSTRYALVPLPFYLKHGESSRLTPRLLVDEGAGTTQTWSLAAARGQAPNAGALAGWEILGTPGYAPAFVRLALADWGQLPAEVRITAASGILSALRRASGGGKVAVLLDREQAKALPTLPFAASLEIVTTSRPLPSTLFCTVGAPGAGKRDPVIETLPRLHESKEGAAALAAMRMARFVPLDPGLLAPIRAAYAEAGATP